ILHVCPRAPSIDQGLCTMQAVHEFLLEKGGRVRQMELIDHFTAPCGCNDQQKEGAGWELLRGIVDNVGFVEVENGVKFVCLNGEGCEESVMRKDADGHVDAECNGNIQETTESGTPTTAGGGEVRLRDRRRRESAPAIGTHDLDQAHAAGSHNHLVRGTRRVCLSEDSALEGLESVGEIQTPKGSRRNFIELMMSSSPHVRRSLINRGSRIRDSVRSDGDSLSVLSSATDEDSSSVTLDPLEHEWMLCASDGLWESLQPLLAVEPSLVAKRDFVTGFTCLHWAAKHGKAELLSQLLDFAKENTIPVNVNARSSAGYTPLHLAAIHGHTQVVRVLLSDWEADPEARDYSGRRAIQYLSPLLAADLEREGLVTSPGPESDTENANGGSSRTRGWRLPKVLQGNLKSLRLLTSPPETPEESEKTKGGLQRKSSLSRLNARLHRGRHRAQIIHSASFRDTGEVGRGEELPRSPLRARPLSNLFG
uniref:Sosondowah ankyrin repeat domain family member C n=1 Tax=Xiphophorus couchianus TaxID=32473 RepID=A0A3B5MCL5_9TELE